MTGYGSVPPQAYTRDTLVKAIDWVAHQPESLRAQATNADTLVALYLQSKRRGTPSTYPVSGESFTEDLKSLAKDLEQFSTPASAPPVSSPLSTREHVPPPPRASFTEPAPLAQWNVDSKSWTQARQLKERLNLSSESEALRMMIALGAERLSALLS
jgi:hypothetical protein